MITRRLSSDPFLRQDPRADLRDYSSETPVSPYLPYVEIVNWCEQFARGVPPEIEVELLRGVFALASWGVGDGDRIRDQALEVALRDRPKTFDGPAVRIEDCSAAGGKLRLPVQKASYFDLCRSNLALDYRYRDSSRRGVDVAGSAASGVWDKIATAQRPANGEHAGDCSAHHGSRGRRSHALSRPALP